MTAPDAPSPVPEPPGPGAGRERDGPPFVEEALWADAVVREERGRWIVYLDVVLASGAVRRKVGDHPDRRRAEQAARIIERNARRHIVQDSSEG